MGWLIGVLVALLALGALALAFPPFFGPVLAGFAPLLLVIALIGLGGVWWRHTQRPVAARPKADQPGASMEDERPSA